MSLRRREAWPWWLLVLASLAAGIFLRTCQLGSQTLIDDEWHAVRMLIRADMAGIATHFGLADYCIPLTLYYRWLYDLGALSEWQMHLPLLLAGIALLLWAACQRHLAPLPVRAAWVGLLAISPQLVYFSRTARPYALVAVLAPAAILAFREWRSRDRRRWPWALLYIGTTFLAGWLHLLSLVFTLWPFAHYGVLALRDLARGRAQARRELLELIGLGLLTSAPLIAALALPFVNDWGAMAGKSGLDSITPQSLYRTGLMMFGVGAWWLFVPLLALCAVGAWRHARRDRDLVVLVLGMSVVGVSVIAAARPAWIQHAAAMARYAVSVLPFLLLFVAEGLVDLAGRLRSLASAGVAAVLVALVALGPMPGWFQRWPNQYVEHAIFQFDYDERENPYAQLLELGPVSPFYRDLAKQPPGSLTLIETPASFNSNYTPGPWLQAIHRQKLKFALASPVCGVGRWDEYSYLATGIRFRRVVPLGDVFDGATYGARYLVMRLQPWSLPPGLEQAWPDMADCVAKAEAKLGAPVYRDEGIVVFALGGHPPER
ncbi:hypothetical protein [Dokdonella sp.]|uniref:hypothetical protein n=1 Tax=Dokdonella sp. TaxID=2291710 RepID=UPI002628957C|nr:hypothetical protein [Dokdonella sp.]